MNENISAFEVMTVNEFTRLLKTMMDQQFHDVWISGEISNFKDHHASGHAYFSLKDDQAVLKACLFKPHRKKIRFDLEDGLKVTAHGRIDVYNKRGEYQIIVEHLIPDGIGALQLAFDQLKDRLEKAGLFDPEHKKAIPPYPQSIGVVTSATGAAIQDILNVLNRRFSGVDVFIYPAQVQGDAAGKDIAAKIRLANKMKIADVLIVGRGGGSIEDLWAFNEEVVANAIFESDIPIISAVGHEVDFTISDFVADLRAPTPSAAAELVVASKDTLMETLDLYSSRMETVMSRLVDSSKERLRYVSADVLSRLFSQQIDQQRMSCDHAVQSLSKNMDQIFSRVQGRFTLNYEKLMTLGPSSILKRGYSLVYLVKDGDNVLLNSDKNLKGNDQLEIYFHKGKVKAIVENEK